MNFMYRSLETKGLSERAFSPELLRRDRNKGCQEKRDPQISVQLNQQGNSGLIFPIEQLLLIILTYIIIINIG